MREALTALADASEAILAGAPTDPAVLEAAHDLRRLADEMDRREFAPQELKEMAFSSQDFSRGQRDHRRPSKPKDKS